jgi:hypothetical protein
MQRTQCCHGGLSGLCEGGGLYAFGRARNVAERQLAVRACCLFVQRIARSHQPVPRAVSDVWRVYRLACGVVAQARA